VAQIATPGCCTLSAVQLPANTFSDYRTPNQSPIPRNLPWNSTENKTSFVLE